MAKTPRPTVTYTGPSGQHCPAIDGLTELVPGRTYPCPSVALLTVLVGQNASHWTRPTTKGEE